MFGRDESFVWKLDSTGVVDRYYSPGLYSSDVNNLMKYVKEGMFLDGDEWVFRMGNLLFKDFCQMEITR